MFSEILSSFENFNCIDIRPKQTGKFEIIKLPISIFVLFKSGTL